MRKRSGGGPAGSEEWGKGGHDLYPIIYVPRPIIVAQVRTILRLSILDHRIQPTFFPSVLRNNLAPLFLFHGVEFLSNVHPMRGIVVWGGG